MCIDWQHVNRSGSVCHTRTFWRYERTYSWNFWLYLRQILIDFDNFCIIETGMNGMSILPTKYKLFHFKLTMSSLYIIKLTITQNSRSLTAAFSWIDCSKILQKVVQCSFFPYLLEHSFSSLPTKNFAFWLFYKKIIFKLDMVNFNR